MRRRQRRPAAAAAVADMRLSRGQKSPLMCTCLAALFPSSLENNDYDNGDDNDGVGDDDDEGGVGDDDDECRTPVAGEL